MKRIRLVIVRAIAYRLSDRAGYNLLRFARRRGWATWSELDNYDYEANRERDLQYLRWRRATDKPVNKS